MKRLVTVESVIQPDADPDSWQQVAHAEVHLRTSGHKKLPPRAVTFPGGTVGNVTHADQDRFTVLLRADTHADLIANLARVAEPDDNDNSENPVANSMLDGDIWCNVHYR